MAMNRRHVLGMGAAAAAAGAAAVTAGTAFGQEDDENVVPRTHDQACNRIRRVYDREVRRAGGTWSSYVSVTGQDGTPLEAVSANPDAVVGADSVNKIAVSVAVLDKIDRGLLTLDQRVEITADIVIQDTDGTIALDRAYPSSVTLGHVMSILLTVSDNTCVRLCGLVCPALELNEILRAKGFVHTQVRPVANPNRFFLGNTTPREMHTLLGKLVRGELLSATSTDFLLNILRSTSAFTDGIRLNLTTNERLRVATKAGWFANRRSEAGIMFDAAGRPMVTYSLFADGPYNGNTADSSADNFSSTHPALRARATLGRKLLDSFAEVSSEGVPAFGPKAYSPVDGG